MRYFTVIATTLLALGPMAASALADSFGGFSADETHYLAGPDSICTPLAIPGGAPAKAAPALSQAPACSRADAGRVAAMKFRRGTEQRGTRAKYVATARGTRLEVKAVGGTGAGAGTLVTWTALDPISQVSAVYTSPGEKLLAVEFQTRFAGRLRTDVVAFVLPAPPPASATPGQADPAGAKPNQGPPAKAGPALSPAMQKTLARARAQSRRGRHKQALAGYRAILQEDPDHAEARYGVARSLAGRRDVEGALAALEALAASGRDDAVVWQVEARFDKVFARLRGNARFRRATGLDRSAGAARPLYERLLGFANTWEQAEVKCEKAQVNLDMDRLARTFSLRITSRCGGYKDQIRLHGTFRLSEPDRVTLVLPNKKTANDAIQCALQVCSGEDCLHCQVDRDLDFMLRPVRR